MEKKVLAAASYDNKKYFFDEAFQGLPGEVKSQLQKICVALAEKLLCTFIIGFSQEGEIYFEIIQSDQIVDFDDIGAKLEIKKVERENEELLKNIAHWYRIFHTPEGQKLKEVLLKDPQSIEKI